MSRSKRKNPYFKVADNISNKVSRTKANRLHRRVNKYLIRMGKYPIALRELTDVWDFKSDGLAIYIKPKPEWMRK